MVVKNYISIIMISYCPESFTDSCEFVNKFSTSNAINMICLVNDILWYFTNSIINIISCRWIILITAEFFDIYKSIFKWNDIIVWVPVHRNPQWVTMSDLFWFIVVFTQTPISIDFNWHLLTLDYIRHISGGSTCFCFWIAIKQKIARETASARTAIR